MFAPRLPLPPQLTSVNKMLRGMYMAMLPGQDTCAPSVTANTISPGVIRLFSTRLSQMPIYLPTRRGNEQLTQSPQMPVLDCEVTPRKSELPDDMDWHQDYPKICSIPTCYQLLLPPSCPQHTVVAGKAETRPRRSSPKPHSWDPVVGRLGYSSKHAILCSVTSATVT